MISRYRMSLDDVQLDSFDDRICILDIAYSELEKTDKTFITANLDGYDSNDAYVSRQTVSVAFELRVYNTAERNAIVQRINKWVCDGNEHVLKTNDREGQSLTVVCDKGISIHSVRNWLDAIVITFVTKTNPYWESITPKTVTLTGKNSKSTLKMDGNTKDALVSVDITTVDVVSSLRIVVGSTNLEFKKLSVGKNKKIVVDYLKNRYLRVRADGQSIMGKLQTSSTDNLKAKCGVNNSVSIVSDGRITAVLSGKGLWL